MTKQTVKWHIKSAADAQRRANGLKSVISLDTLLTLQVLIYAVRLLEESNRLLGARPAPRPRRWCEFCEAGMICPNCGVDTHVVRRKPVVLPVRINGVLHEAVNEESLAPGRDPHGYLQRKVPVIEVRKVKENQC